MRRMHANAPAANPKLFRSNYPHCCPSKLGEDRPLFAIVIEKARCVQGSKLWRRSGRCPSAASRVGRGGGAASAVNTASDLSWTVYRARLARPAPPAFPLNLPASRQGAPPPPPAAEPSPHHTRDIPPVTERKCSRSLLQDGTGHAPRIKKKHTDAVRFDVKRA